MTGHTEGPLVVCAICRRTLNTEVVLGPAGIEVHHQHGVTLDPTIPAHDPVAIVVSDTGEVVTACDFCTFARGTWSYPAADFEVLVGVSPSGGTLTHASRGGFVACDPCHDDIEADRWADVMTRFLAGGTPSRGVAALHAGFRAHRLGPAEPLC